MLPIPKRFSLRSALLSQLETTEGDIWAHLPRSTGSTKTTPTSQRESVPKLGVDVFGTPNACVRWNGDLMGDGLTLQSLFMPVSSQNKIIICPVCLAPVECLDPDHCCVVLGKSVELSASDSAPVNQG